MKNVSNGIDTGDRQGRVDATYAPDARKARIVVRDKASHSLVVLAEAIAVVTAEQDVKIRLQERAEAYRNALRVYGKEELRPDNFDIGWMGPRNGLMPVLSGEAPEHKRELAKAWNAMLIEVNAATKVGVEKLNRFAPITLQVDLGDAPQFVNGGISWN